jgi:hypothetical protein
MTDKPNASVSVIGHGGRPSCDVRSGADCRTRGFATLIVMVISCGTAVRHSLLSESQCKCPAVELSLRKRERLLHVIALCSTKDRLFLNAYLPSPFPYRSRATRSSTLNRLVAKSVPLGRSTNSLLSDGHPFRPSVGAVLYVPNLDGLFYSSASQLP